MSCERSGYNNKFKCTECTCNYCGSRKQLYIPTNPIKYVNAYSGDKIITPEEIRTNNHYNRIYNDM